MAELTEIESKTFTARDFRLENGKSLPVLELAYETYGTLAPQRDNAILVVHGYTSGHHAAGRNARGKAGRGVTEGSPGWFDALIGPGKAIDTDRWFVICVNSLGSCKGSTGPASIDPQTGKTYRLDFPELTLEDVGNSAFELVRGLGIERLAAVVGCSIGGMSALGYLIHHPGSARAYVSVSTAPQARPFAIAIRSLQREAIRLDPNWNEGNYDEDHFPDTGMSIARKLGVITYRSAIEWSGRFGRIRLDPEQRDEEPFGAEFQVESYLNAHARRFVRAFDPNSYLYLSRSADWFDVAEYAGPDAGDQPGAAVRAGLARIELERALVIGVETDILFPLEQQQEIAEGLRAAGAEVDFAGLDSPQGHDAFLVDTARFGAVIGRFMATL